MRIGLVAGEASGDLLGAGLMREIRARHPDVRFEGVAGPLMQREGCDTWEESEALAVMGLIEPLREIPRLLRLRRSLVSRWAADPPDVFVGIDAPDFNLGLELKLRALGVPTVHYVSPSVWAWRQGRIRKIAKAVDRVLCLLPFEKDFYDRHGVAADFVGHPMADNLPANLDRRTEREALGLRSALVVAVMPGSRAGEVARLGPVFAATAAILAERHGDISFVAPMINARVRSRFEQQLENEGVASLFTLTDGDAPRAIAASDVVLLASGTAALEAALLQRPIVAAYRLAPLTYFFVSTLRLVRLDYFTLPNLLTDVPLVPEFLQGAASAEALSAAVSALLVDPERRRAIEATFHELRARLGQHADRRAAAAVIDLAGAAATGS